MALRLVISINAAPGKGGELAAAFKTRCLEVVKEPGCQQFEVFQSVVDPDRLTLLELWDDDAALEAHMKVNATRAPIDPSLRAPGGNGREDYTYAKKG